MVFFSGYRLLSQIYESTYSIVYRAYQESDGQPVILKVLKQRQSSPQKLIQYRQEYEITHHLNLAGIIKAYELKPYQDTFAIVFEDFGGEDLTYLCRYPHHHSSLSIAEWLRLFIQITISLGQIHHHRIIHKDINPSNIVFNPQTQQLKIIDFGISTQLSQENSPFTPPSCIEGTFAYLSPEQTGRMNRMLDYRTDFYSLGVTFYELLTQQLPFSTIDPLELVHCHLAKQPVAPHELNPAVPAMLSEIVLKLMAKNADDRYQSARGLEVDLNHCLTRLEMTGTIASFPLGREDRSPHFRIPQKLYGREAALSDLLAAFDHNTARRTGGTEAAGNNWPTTATKAAEPMKIVLVTGAAGIGKTSLVREIYKPVTAKRGYFIAGKFDQLQRTTPYSAIVEAFTELVHHLLGAPIEQLQSYQAQLITALGANAQVMIDVIPELALILGASSPVSSLGMIEAQNRFKLTFRKFIQVFCSMEYPLVIFLDDLQWADTASLNLIEQLLTDPALVPPFIIAAYRDRAIHPSHPLHQWLANLRQQSVHFRELHLESLTVAQVGHLIADTLHAVPREVDPLAQLVWHKTNGNPFAVNEFLKMLYAEGLMRLHDQSYQWCWDIEQIAAQNITDNVVELIVGKLKQLPTATQDVLCLAACIGAEFDLDRLATIAGYPATELFTHLQAALQAEVIIPLSKLDEQLLIQQYRFLHDRVQQAAYSLMDASTRTATHLRMGRLLQQRMAPSDRPDAVFTVVDHYNHGVAAVTSNTEAIEIAQLNLAAGRRAKASIAFTQALTYFETGIQLLQANAWEEQYALALALHEEAAEAACFSGQFDRMETLIQTVLHQAHTRLDPVSVHKTRLQALILQDRLPEAIQSTLEVLTRLGVTFPTQPEDTDVEQALQQTEALLANRSPATLVSLPRMRDQTHCVVMDLLSELHLPCYHLSPKLFALIVVQQVQQSFHYGNAPASCAAYALYATLLTGNPAHVQRGALFGQLAIDLIDQLHLRSLQGRVTHLVNLFIKPWHEPLDAILASCQEMYQICLETGDIVYAALSAHVYCVYSFMRGMPLPQLAQEIETYSVGIRHLRQDVALHFNQIIWQTALNLLDQAEDPCQLIGTVYDESTRLSPVEQTPNSTVLFLLYSQKMLLCYLFQAFAAAVNYADRALQYLDGVKGMYHLPVFYGYSSLARLAYLSEVSPDDRDAEVADQQWAIVTQQQQQLAQWAHHAPQNAHHKYLLVAAEQARIRGDHATARELYDQSIALAQQQQFLPDVALGNELAAHYYWTRAQPKIAQVYIQEASYAYTHWGAIAKVNALATQYPQFFQVADSIARVPAPSRSSASTTNRQDQNLDLAAIMKASQAIASEIRLDTLLAQLMKILLEQSGATRGCLLLPHHQTFCIEAEGRADPEPIAVLQSIPIANHLPESLINYVARTSEPIVLHNAMNEDRFTHDPYIVTHHSKSILCTALTNQGEQIAIVYLENDLITGAFTSDRMEVLQLLSRQAAIAITNAKLYSEVQANERKLTQLIEAMPIAVSVLNAQGQPYYANQRAIELLGQGIEPTVPAEQISQFYRIYQAGTDHLYPAAELPIIRAFKGEASHADNLEIRRDDQVIAIETWASPIYDEQGQLIYGLSVFQDITERKHLEQLLRIYNRNLEHQIAERTTALIESERKFRTAFEQAVVGMGLVAPDGQFLSVNSALCEMTGYPEDELKALTFPDITYPDDIEISLYYANKLLSGELSHYYLEKRYCCKHGDIIWVLLSSCLIRDTQKNPLYFIIQIQDITQRKQAEAELKQVNSELQRLASLDGLTQLANRRYFNEYLSQEWQRSSREQHPLSLILCDVDYFKRYNDSYGHLGGDDCLVQVARAIDRAVKRPTDLATRYGGEEFAVILPHTNLEGAYAVAQMIQAEVRQLAMPHEQSLVSEIVTLSLGVASIVATPHQSAETLIGLADAALYQAKQAGRDRIVAPDLTAPESQE